MPTELPTESRTMDDWGKTLVRFVRYVMEDGRLEFAREDYMWEDEDEVLQLSSVELSDDDLLNLAERFISEGESAP